MCVGVCVCVLFFLFVIDMSLIVSCLQNLHSFNHAAEEFKKMYVSEDGTQKTIILGIDSVHVSSPIHACGQFVDHLSFGICAL